MDHSPRRKKAREAYCIYPNHRMFTGLGLGLGSLTVEVCCFTRANTSGVVCGGFHYERQSVLLSENDTTVVAGQVENRTVRMKTFCIKAVTALSVVESASRRFALETGLAGSYDSKINWRRPETIRGKRRTHTPRRAPNPTLEKNPLSVLSIHVGQCEERDRVARVTALLSRTFIRY